MITELYQIQERPGWSRYQLGYFATYQCAYEYDRYYNIGGQTQGGSDRWYINFDFPRERIADAIASWQKPEYFVCSDGTSGSGTPGGLPTAPLPGIPPAVPPVPSPAPQPPSPPTGGPSPIPQSPPDTGGGGCPCPDDTGGGGGGGSDDGGSQSCVKRSSEDKSGDDTSSAFDPVTGLPYCDSLPQADKCCKEAFKAIADAMKLIADAISKRFELTEEMLAEIYDYVHEKLTDKYILIEKTCDHCCKLVELGLAEASSCTVISANCTCSACEAECTLASEGKCCKTCGRDKCTCKSGECVPVEPDSEPTADKWQVFCRNNEALVFQSPANTPPYDDAVYIGSYDTESEARNAGRQCTLAESPLPYPPPRPPAVPQPSPSPASISCTGQAYSSHANADAFLVENAISEAWAIQAEQFAESFAVSLAEKATWIPIVGDAVRASVIQSQAPIAQATSWGPLMTELVGCSSPGVNAAVVTLAMAGAIQSKIGVDLSPYLLHIEYGLNAACRKRILSPAQAMAGVLSNAVPIDNLDWYYAAAGYCTGVSDIDLHSSKAKPNLNELAQFRRRGWIDQQQFANGARQLGYIDPQLSETLFGLTEQLPPYSDIVRMMVRDSEDDRIVEQFDLDAEFDQKYKGQLKEWAKGQGVPDKVMQYLWRAHWDIPSNTALYTMLHRLRHNNVPEAIRTTEADVKTAMQQNDVAPFWVDRLLAISYAPLGRIDLRRSYQSGTLTDDELKRGLAELGYSDDGIEKLSKFFARLKQQAAVSHLAIKQWTTLAIDGNIARQRMADDGYTDEQIATAMDDASVKFAGSPWVKAYMAGYIGRQQLSTLLTAHGVSAQSADKLIDRLSYLKRDTKTVSLYSTGVITRATAAARLTEAGIAPAVADDMLSDADESMQSKQAAKCADAIRKRVIRGELDFDEAKAKLLGYGIVQEFADKLVSGWRCEANAIDKTVPANTMCGWFARGSLSAADFRDRLVKIGYTEADALQLMDDCSDRIATRQAKEDAKRERDEESRKRKAESAAKRAESRATQLLRQAEAARKAKNQLRATRQSQEFTTLKNIMQRCDCTEVEAVRLYNQNSERLRSATPLSYDETLRVLLKASESWGGGDPATFQPIADEFAKQAIESGDEVLIPEP